MYGVSSLHIPGFCGSGFSRDNSSPGFSKIKAEAAPTIRQDRRIGRTKMRPEGEVQGCAESQFGRTAELDDRQVAHRVRSRDGSNHKVYSLADAESGFKYRSVRNRNHVRDSLDSCSN